MSSRFKYTPLAFSLLALHGQSALADDAVSPVTPETPAPVAAPVAGSNEAAPAQELGEVVVKAQAEVPYTVEKVSSPKYTEALRDTPQTITVVTKEAIKDQGMLSLREILSTVPGITFGAGEGGGGYGDSINIRGFSSSSDISIDGIRDSAQYTRSDPFNLEQVEVVKGASSVYSGSGAVGGTVNLVSKAPKADNFTNLSAGVGTDQYYRLTVDTNKKVNETTAVRLNVMAHTNDVPGRDYETMERWGIAPSVTFGMGTPTRFTLAYFHQSDDNIPQYGVPFYNGRAVPGVSSSNYYGYHNLDEQKTDVDSFTAIFDQEVNKNLSFRNLTRVSRVKQFALVDPPQGNFCLGNNTQPSGWSQTANATGPVTVTTNTTGYTSCSRVYSGTPGATAGPNYVYTNGPFLQPGQYAPSGPRGNIRDTTTDSFINQFDATWNFNTGSVAHTVVTGVALSLEQYDFNGYSEFREANGWAFNPSTTYLPTGDTPLMDVYNPDSTYRGRRNRTLTGLNTASQETQAVYAFDTLKFTEQWWLNLGVRYDHVNGDNTSYGVNTYTAPSTATPNPAGNLLPIGQRNGKNATTNQNDDLISYRGGLMYKPVEYGTLYISYGNSKTPSVSAVSGACTATSTTGTSNCNVDPETAVTYEFGGKIDLLEGRISTNVALFRTERTNYRVSDPGNPDNPSGQQQLDGRSRVEGVELGVGGLIRQNWSVFANLTRQHSEVLRGASRFVASGGATGTEQDWTKGDSLTQVPELAASLWTTYDLTRSLQFGYGVTYQGEVYLTQHFGIARSGTGAPTPTQYVGRSTIPLVESEDYFVHNASATYKFNRNLNVQLNVKNLFDKEYYTRMRNNGWATPGDARSAVATVNYSF